MSIFNSLGSNYNLWFALRALFGTNDPGHSARLKKYLKERYQGQVMLTYKAREAIVMALDMLNIPQGSMVAINGYTCYAVYRAIADSGCSAAYLDIADNDLNFSADDFAACIAAHPSLKAVIIQNTLGFACDIKSIQALCQRHHIALIEDLAHSIGSTYRGGAEAGSFGDFVVLSFSQDKIVDGISGGALIVRNKQYRDAAGEESRKVFADIPKKQQIIDRGYPFFSWLIRQTYDVGLGRIMHAVLKKAGLLPQPLRHGQKIILHRLPDWQCGLIYRQFQTLPRDLQHRRAVALTYVERLNRKILFPDLVSDIAHSANLRFPVRIRASRVGSRAGLISRLKEQGIHVSDIWYDAPVAPEKYLRFTDYHAGQCPVAEALSAEMLNLPTHGNVTPAQAKIISEKINAWLA